MFQFSGEVYLFIVVCVLFSEMLWFLWEITHISLNVTGHNSRKLWADITSAIKTVYLQKESALISATNKYTSSRSEVVLYSQNTVLLLYIESVFLHSIKISLKFQKFLWNGSIWFCIGWGFECLPDGGERLTSAW